MAFDWRIAAIELRLGHYRVIAEDDFGGANEIDWVGFSAAYPLRDVGDESLYVDEATLVTRDQLRPFVRGKKAQTFLDLYANGAFVLLVHRGEYESGMPD